MSVKFHNGNSAAVAVTAIAIGCLIYAIRLGGSAIQSFLLYNLPDGLWAFGFATLVLSLPLLYRPVVWASTVGIIGVLGELLQARQRIPGTYDPLDILCYIGGTLFAIFIHQFLHPKTVHP